MDKFTFKNKTVAFVGLAPHLKGAGLGAEIDSFDIVYRTNFYPLPEALHKDYGSRCDVIGMQSDYEPYVPTYVQNGVQCIVNYLKQLDTKGASQIKVTAQVKKNIANVMEQLTGQKIQAPTAGVIAYFVSKMFKCKSFKYFGISGYQGKHKGIVKNHNGANNYIKEYLDFWRENDKGYLLKTNMRADKYHNFEAHNIFMKKLIESNLVEIDSLSKQFFL